MEAVGFYCSHSKHVQKNENDKVRFFISIDYFQKQRDMVITYERDIYSYDRYGYRDKLLEHRKDAINCEQIKEWRKGFCICKSNENHFKYFYIVNHKSEAICCVSSIDDEFDSIQRIFGGYYVVFEKKWECIRTFPGQDRDTEYKEYYSAARIYNEAGTILNDEEKDNFIKTHDIYDSYLELGEGIISKGSSIYKLSDYSYIADIPSNASIKGKFIHGKCDIWMNNDFRDFYVLVKNQYVYKVFERDIFESIVKILGSDILRKENVQISKSETPSESIKIKPKIIPIIHNYLYGFPKKYNCPATNFASEKFGVHKYCMAFQSAIYTGYYFENGIWYKLDAEDVKESIDELCSKYFPVKNYIRNIFKIKDGIHCDDGNYDLYLFKCRPFGYMNKKGIINYSFDINRIEW